MIVVHVHEEQVVVVAYEGHATTGVGFIETTTKEEEVEEEEEEEGGWGIEGLIGGVNRAC